MTTVEVISRDRYMVYSATSILGFFGCLVSTTGGEFLREEIVGRRAFSEYDQDKLRIGAEFLLVKTRETSDQGNVRTYEEFVFDGE